MNSMLCATATRRRCSWARRNNADAEPLLLAGYEGKIQREKTMRGQGRVRVTEVLDRRIGLSIATNKPDGVKNWQAKQVNYREVRLTPPEKK